MIDWEEAQQRLLKLAKPLSSENVPLNEANNRYLSHDVIAKRTQPAVDLSAMDGYAIRYADLKTQMAVIGESAAGQPYGGVVNPGNAVRIFTGAHVPRGADTILVQEEAFISHNILNLNGNGPAKIGQHVRKLGSDFVTGDVLLHKGQRISAGAIAVSAMANYSELPVHKSPVIGILACGNELINPGEQIKDTQIPSSNSAMLRAMISGLPCRVLDHGIARDNIKDLKRKLDEAAGHHVIVITGGASVGDHDLVQDALKEMGADIDFWRVSIRPGKPIMAGKLGKTIVLGLPGNPASAFVTATLFLLPLIRHFAGAASPFAQIVSAKSLQALPANGNRTEFMRAYVDNNGIRTFGGKDSGLTKPLAMANALLIRPAHATEIEIGEAQNFIYL
jgi:molybdopterin molybdotransferase